MVHYIANIISQPEVISNREAIFSEAGYKRAMFVCSAIEDNITIVSMGAGNKKGFFRKTIENHSQKIKIVYLPQWHLIIFKKKLRHTFYSFFLFVYLVKNVKRNDKLILYNSSKSFFMIMPVLVYKIFRNVKYILEIEELYSYVKNSKRLDFAERISINNAAAYLIVNNNIKKFIKSDKSVLINAGYYSLGEDAEINIDTKESDEIQIIYSGRLDKEGGILIFLEAIQFINFSCKIIITGRGEYEEVVKNYKCINPKVAYHYLGVLNENEYYKVLSKSQIGINPILQSNDFGSVSFPSKVTQYLSFGLRVVSSDIQSLNILDELNEYIYTYNSDSPVMLADKLNLLADKNYNEKEIIIEKTKMHFEKSKYELINFFINV